MTASKTVLKATVAAAALAAATPAAAQQVKLGALMPMTGDLQVYGETSLNGVRLAASEVNEAGGINGEELEIVVGDTQTAPQPGVNAAQRLVNAESVHGVVGALSSGVTIPVARSVTSSAGVPQISSASTSPVITGIEDNDFLFRTVPSDAFQGKKLAELVDRKGPSNVGVVYVNNDYGQGLNDTFAKHFEDMGNTVSASVAYEQGQSSYRGELQRAAANGAQALLLIGYPEYGNVILRQALEGGYFQDFIFTDGMKSGSVIDTIGAEFLNGSYGTAPQSRDTQASQRFKSLYEQQYGKKPPKPFINSSYDATMLLALAAVAADETSRTAIRDHLRDVANPPGKTVIPGEFADAKQMLKNGKDINYRGAAGPQDFDKNGDVPGTIAHWAFKNGKVQTVEMLD